MQRAAAFALVLATCAWGCNLQRAGTTPGPPQAEGTTDYGSGIDLSIPDPTPDSPDGRPAPGAPTPRPRPQAAPKPGAPAGGSGTIVESGRALLNDRGGTGANNKLYLTGEVPRLVVEIGAVAGREPTSEALAHVGRVLESVVDKPGGIEFRLTRVFDAPKSSYAQSDLITIEEDHRQTWSDETSATLYLLFLNGELRGAPSVLGVAWRGSSIAIFTDKIRSSVSGLVPLSIEKAVITHEVGHALSLVNLTYKSPRNHEDPAHRGHSSNRGSVMYWAVERADLVEQVFGEGPPDDFDADDRADLRDIREGRLG